MVTQIKLGEITVNVVKKGIKNIHLSVYPPTGNVRISAPFRMNLDNIRVFAITKLGWIKSRPDFRKSKYIDDSILQKVAKELGYTN